MSLHSNVHQTPHGFDNEYEGKNQGLSEHGDSDLQREWRSVKDMRSIGNLGDDLPQHHGILLCSPHLGQLI